jgi:hypothetical protein
MNRSYARDQTDLVLNTITRNISNNGPINPGKIIALASRDLLVLKPLLNSKDGSVPASEGALLSP